MPNQMTNKKHILLVDDERNLTQMLSMLLETRGYDVQIACSGQEALRKVSANLDLIILDLVLHDVNGFEVCRQLKEDKSTSHIPIIMLSAHALYADKVEGLYLGADDFLSKPCEYEELFARMEAVMRRGPRWKTSDINQRDQDSVIFELRKILDEKLITPHFQPLYLFEPLKLLGVELLARPISDGFLSSPERFFKESLKYGMYSDMEILSWSLALPILAQTLKTQKIFLNCNPYFIESMDFLVVKSLFEETNISPRNVILEITERSAISNYKLFYKQLQRYREYGFGFAVDDVGGGYASLESVVQTKPEVIKIDRHIISNLKNDLFKRSIVKFVVSFCQENNILSIAEGIQSKEDLEIVKDLGVDGGQGYYLFRPTPKITLDKIASPLLK
jgi:EAL domain-containing protein (putative c-di-GMP-specific phosphodiesterase class I)/FixJ family two-component response regulator